MLEAVLTTTAMVGGVGAFVGIFLAIASKLFATEPEDPRITEVEQALPGNNCGGCGYPGCSGCAAAIVAGDAPVNACPVGGAAVAAVISGIMGADVPAPRERMTAYVHCQGNTRTTHYDYDYYGIEDCRMLAFVPNGGPKSCNYGCLGYGSCVSVCQFDAIHVDSGVAVVDPDKCAACGRCVEVCPKHLISLEPYDATSIVTCKSCDKGPDTMSKCDIGCIGCGICARKCPAGAITVADFHAEINQDLCDGCGTCVAVCPRHCIAPNMIEAGGV